MRIEYISHPLPSRRVTNVDAVELIRKHSSDFDGGVAQIERVVKRLLHLAGARTRYWPADNESPSGLIKKACDRALIANQMDEIVFASNFVHSHIGQP